MEIAINPAMPTYSGGLGVLAGDTIALGGRPGRSAGGLHAGCTARDISSSIWTARACRARMFSRGIRRISAPRSRRGLRFRVEDRIVTVRAWRYDLAGRYGHVVPIYLLDTDLDGNSGWDRGLTDHLYGGDTNYRLQQEIVLGMGGARMANALGSTSMSIT